MPGDNQNTSAEGARAQQNEQERKTQTVGEALQQGRQEQVERSEKLSKEQADALYEERMEEGYAKRESGA